MANDNLTITVERANLTITTGAIPVSSGSASLGPDLTAIEALTGTGLAHRTASDTWALETVTAAGLAILDDADATAQRATLGLVIGTNVLAYDAGLTSLAGVDTAADLLPYTTGANAWAATSLSAFARTLLDDADQATARATLGITTGAETVVAVATPATTTADSTTGVSSGMAFALGVGTYVISIVLSMTSLITTTAPRFSLQGTGGLVVSSCVGSISVPSTDTATQHSNWMNLGDWSLGTNGPGSAWTRPVTIDVLIVVTTAGTATLWLRSEVSGSDVTIIAGAGVATKCT